MHTALVNFENTAGMDFAEYRERAQSDPDSLKRQTKSTPPLSDVRELVGYREIFKSPQDTLGQKVFQD
ncbi:MAG: hypothetical protein IJ228_03350 [Succinivibrio sp.]|nr:hypothetical protein [Succinivibrio sp.]